LREGGSFSARGWLYLSVSVALAEHIIQAELLFQFCSSRNERGSLIITTNLEFPKWTEVFSDAGMTAALLDRLTHRAHILNINGESYRFKQAFAMQTTNE